MRLGKTFWQEIIKWTDKEPWLSSVEYRPAISRFPKFSRAMTTLHTASERHPQIDAWGRILPEMPHKPYPSARIQYRPGTELVLKPHPEHPHGASKNVVLKITRFCNANSRSFAQVVSCLVTDGPLSIKGTETIACLFDPLYVSPDYLRDIKVDGNPVIESQ